MRSKDHSESARAEFEKAPAAIQAEFWAAIRKRTDWEHELEQFRESVDDPEAAPPIELRHREPRRVRWDARWQRRAIRYRDAEERGRRVDEDFDCQFERLTAIDATEFVERLTGFEIRQKMRCPLPGHDERTPSFTIRENRWKCWGCSESGSIYDLAGMLWGLERHGADFRRIHDRLLELWP